MTRPENHTPPTPPSSPDNGSIRETIESIIIAFILAFVFRAFVVEAFVIPTGSMAPTLLGKHVSLTCPQCGYRFAVGPRYAGARHPPRPIQGSAADPLTARCPMCNYPITQTRRAIDAGDRILVLKYLYGISEPRRWDVVVFKNPENPADNYIKRLIGLPNERLWIVRGNIYTQKLDDTGQPLHPDLWTIQRKTLRPKVQRAVWQPIYHSEYVPLDGGDPNAKKVKTERISPWRLPWRPAPGQQDRWRRRHAGRILDFTGSTDPAELQFDYPNRMATRDYYPYNFASSGHYGEKDMFIVEDLRLAATFMPQADASAVFFLKTHRYQFRVTVDTRSPRPGIEVKGNGFGDWTTPKKTIFHRTGRALRIGRPTPVELWHVDQNLQLWIDGDLWAEWRYDNQLSTDELHRIDRERITENPTIRMTVCGAPMTLSHLEVDRDLYYTPDARAAYDNHVRGTADNIARIGPDRFFCLGDNSPFSKDGRLWTYVDPWIRYHSKLLGHEVGPGYVPREMMIGRAFFVYFPAPYRFNATGPWLVPNIGKLRFIH